MDGIAGIDLLVWSLRGLIALLSSLAALAAYNLWFHPLASVPGPRLAAASPLWMMRTLLRRRLNPDLCSLHARYGPVVRIAPEEVSFATVESQSAIYAGGPDFPKSRTIQNVLGDTMLGAPNLATITDRKKHMAFRKRLQPTFTTTALLKHESLQQLHISEITRTLDTAAVTGEEVNLTSESGQMVWDLIGDLSFGEPLLAGDRWVLARAVDWIVFLAPFVEGLIYVMRLPGFSWFIDLLLTVLPGSLVPIKTATRLLSFSKLRSCIERQDGREDLLTSLMAAKDGVTLTNPEILSNATMFVFGGYETSQTALSGAFYFLLRHPHYLRMLEDEVRSAFATPDEIGGTALLKLPFLNACIQESLRLLPPVNGKISARICKGANLHGVYLPANTIVSSDIYSIQRSAKYFRDPDDFRPERWIDPSYDDTLSAARPFLLGARACIGKHLALQIVRFTLARLIFDFNFENALGDFVWERDVSSSLVWHDFNIKARVTRHKQEQGVMSS